MSFHSLKNNWRVIRLSQLGGCLLYLLPFVCAVALMGLLVYYQRTLALALAFVGAVVLAAVLFLRWLWNRT